MSSTALTIRTNHETKEAIADFASSLGLSTSAFVTAVTLQAMREQRVVLTPPPLEPTPYLEDIMRKADADLAAGRNITTFKSKKAAIAHLRSL